MNKKNIIIGLVIAILVIILIIVLSLTIGRESKDNKKTIEKESVIISGSEYVIFDTTELKLDSTNLSITDLKNISKLNNLEKLDITKSEIDDISFLSDLTKLTSLKTNVNAKLTDYSPLENLTNLFTLEIYGNIGYSSDMSFLSKLSKLNTLYLTFETDRDIEFIKDAKNLSVLSLDVPLETYNKINTMLEETKIVIKTHGKLSNENLNKVEETKIEDGIIKWSTFSEDDTYVISIDLTDEYKDIEKLQKELEKLDNYKNLNTLTITSTEKTLYSVNNLKFLSNLKNLETLNINYLNLNDTSSLSNLVNLKKLSITNGNMANTKFTYLSNLTNIEELNLSMQNITDISFLKDYKNLNKLYLNGNNITDITPLKNITTLTELYIGCNNNLSDISTISNLSNLTNLMITSGNINEKTFANLKSLKNLYLGIDYKDIDKLKQTYPNINIELLSECV